jgi:hypothetical protein
MMIVMQPVLQFPNKSEARRLGMEAEAMKAIFADIEAERADHDPEQIERKDAGSEANNERGKAKRQPDIGAMPQKGPDHGGLPVRFS